jgi:hypothetical protein
MRHSSRGSSLADRCYGCVSWRQNPHDILTAQAPSGKAATQNGPLDSKAIWFGFSDDPATFHSPGIYGLEKPFACARKAGSRQCRMQRSRKLFTGSSLALLTSLALAVGESPIQIPGTATKAPVARLAGGGVMTPVNQVLTPVGQQIDLPGLRPQALALSPDGQILVTAGKTSEVVVLSPFGDILQRPALPSEEANDLADPVSNHILKPDEKGQLSYTGLVFSPDGTRVYLANVDGSIKLFEVSKDHQLIGLGSIPLPHANAPRRKAEIPSGLAVSLDGKRLYVVANLSNHLLELDAATGDVLRSWDTGVAPYAVVLGGKKAYVSNWGGRRPDATSVTGPAGRGTRVRVDAVRFIANEGSVTIIDLLANEVRTEVRVGLHSRPTAVTWSSPMRPAIR